MFLGLIIIGGAPGEGGIAPFMWHWEKAYCFGFVKSSLFFCQSVVHKFKDDIFDEKSNKQKKNSQNFSNKTIIISDYNEKLYNSTKLRNNKRFFQYLNEIDLDKNKTIANSNPDQIFKNSNV